MLSTSLGLLGDLALLGPDLRRRLGDRGVLDTSIDLIVKMRKWSDSSLTKMAAKEKAAASAAGKETPKPAGSDAGAAAPSAVPRGLQTAFGIKRDVVKLIGNVVFRCKGEGRR